MCHVQGMVHEMLLSLYAEEVRHRFGRHGDLGFVLRKCKKGSDRAEWDPWTGLWRNGAGMCDVRASGAGGRGGVLGVAGGLAGG